MSKGKPLCFNYDPEILSAHFRTDSTANSLMTSGAVRQDKVGRGDFEGKSTLSV
jgi:hypothetical protein